jgi:hypothetical protein
MFFENDTSKLLVAAIVNAYRYSTASELDKYSTKRAIDWAVRNGIKTGLLAIAD